MPVQFEKTRYALVVLGMAMSGFAAQAQTMPAQASSSNTYDANRTSWIPYTNNGYIGLNVGRSRFSTACAGGFACDRSDTSGHIYLGG
jgi:OOP family OmpA-OmpF porin